MIYKGLRVRAAVHAGPAHTKQDSQLEHFLYSGPVVDLTVKLGISVRFVFILIYFNFINFKFKVDSHNQANH